MDDNWLVRAVWNNDRNAPYQYSTEHEFVFEYMCMLLFRLLKFW